MFIRAVNTLVLFLLLIFSFATIAAPKSINYAIKTILPFSDQPFTQGLLLDNDILYVSSGLYRKSYIAAYSFPKMTPIRSKAIPSYLFAEGATTMHDSLYLCTWKSKRCFRYDKHSFKLINQFSIKTEGWGLTDNSSSLILSDGTDQLYFIDPKTFKITKTLKVTYNSKPIKNINELEFFKGYIYANIWGSSQIILINSNSGQVDYIIDGSKVVDDMKPNLSKGHVLNGIAIDRLNNQFILTGKKWSNLYVIELDFIPQLNIKTN